MKTICMMMLALALIAVAAGGCRVEGEIGDTSTRVSPAR